jgi:hypothetical protein
MKRMGFLLPLVASALLLAGCGGMGTPVSSAGSTPIDTEQISAGADVAISRAFDALELATSAVDVLIAVKVVVPGTSVALRIADGLCAAKTWLNTARSAQKAALGASYVFAMKQAAIALASANAGVVSVAGGKP